MVRETGNAVPSPGRHADRETVMYLPGSVITGRVDVPTEANGRSRAAHGRRTGHPQYEQGAVLTGMTATSDSTRVTPRGGRRRARRHRIVVNRIVVTGQTFRG